MVHGRRVAAQGVGIAVAAAVSATAVFAFVPAAYAAVAATANPGVGETLRVRSQPNTTATIVANIAHGASISIECKTTGTAVNGITQWDKLSNGYVTHAFVTVPAGVTIPTCGTSGTPTATVRVSAGNSLTVRSTPSTSGTAVTSLANGTSVAVSCKTTGTSVTGTLGTTTTWYKISSGYISAAYASLSGTASTCTTTTPPPTSTARQTIITRAQYWYDASNGRISGVAAFGRDPTKSAKEGPTGSALYRRDCSGLIAMAWQLGSANQPSSTALITSPLVKAINVTDLLAGDILTASGHVTMFHKWSNKAAWQYYAYDFGGGSGGAGPMEYKIYTLNSVSGSMAKRNNDSRQYYARRLIGLT